MYTLTKFPANCSKRFFKEATLVLELKPQMLKTWTQTTSVLWKTDFIAICECLRRKNVGFPPYIVMVDKKARHVPEKTLNFTLKASFCGKAKNKTIFHQGLLSWGHQKRCEWWLHFSSFLSQQEFSPLKWSWVISFSSSGNFSAGDSDLWHEEG